MFQRHRRNVHWTKGTAVPQVTPPSRSSTHTCMSMIETKELKRDMDLSPAWLLCCVQNLWFRWLTCVYVWSWIWRVWLVEQRFLWFSAHFSCAIDMIETNILLLTAFEAVHCSDIVSRFGTFHTHGFVWWYKFLFWLSVVLGHSFRFK